jgi:hypothetical protein
MSVSKDQAADAIQTPDAAELAASQLDAVRGGSPVVAQDVVVHKQTAAEKNAAAADALIRG